MATAKDVLKLIKEKDVKYVDLRFTDPRGKLQHVTFDIALIDEEALTEGLMFDGSSIAGWKVINESDMKLMPDPDSMAIDPFFAQTTLAIVCDVLEPLTNEPYGRDPRSIAKKAIAYLGQTKIGDGAFFGPEAEFFVFDDVKFSVDPYNTGFRVDDVELPSNSGSDYETGNLGHRIRTKGGYFPVPPQDTMQDMRSEMLSAMASMGAKTEKHHHEVAAAQHELGLKFGPLVQMADHLQIYKYCIHNVAHAYGKTATFMPKPVYGDNGSGMHVHQSIWKGNKPLFAGKLYSDLSQEALWYIGGIIKHARSINAFSNPLTNSYKRLVPGLRSAGAARLFLAQPLGLLPYPGGEQPQGQARRGPLPGSGRQPLPGLRRDADGRPRRHQEQDRSRRSGRQEPLRPAAEGAEEDPDGVQLAARSARQPRQGPCLPHGRRRVQRRHDRRLHRAEDGGGHPVRAHAAPGRVRHVLFGLTGGLAEHAKGRPRAPLFYWRGRAEEPPTAPDRSHDLSATWLSSRRR